MGVAVDGTVFLCVAHQRVALFMAFIIGVVFFVIAVGLLDARLPWPRPDRDSRQ
jgi:hypothetical protein